MDFTLAEIILSIGLIGLSFYTYHLFNICVAQKSFIATISESNRSLFYMYNSANLHANKCLDLYKESNEHLVKCKVEQMKRDNANISAET